MNRERDVRNDLGHYGSLAEVWRAFPSGGRPGECLWIGSVLYVWDTAQGNWRSDVYPHHDTYKAVRLHGDLCAGNDLFVGGDLEVMQNTTVKKNLRIEGTLLYSHLQGMDCGLFPSEVGLKYAYPSPKLGQWALVGTDADSLALYACTSSGNWTKQRDGERLSGAIDLTAYNAAKAIVDDMADRGYVFMGAATPGTVPVTPSTYNVFYLTTTPGVYTYFGGVGVKTLSVLSWNHRANPDSNNVAAGAWTVTSLLSGVFVYEENIADGAVTPAKAPLIMQRIKEVEDDAVHSRSVGGVILPDTIGTSGISFRISEETPGTEQQTR